jgi:SAM-dependent methyltransferase
MAKRFQQADVLGIDIAAVPVEAESVPANCQFELDDIELGLPHFENKFDLIHARLITMGLKDFQKSMDDVHRCLKPGGMVIWMEPDFDFFTHDVQKYAQMASDENPRGTWIGRFAYGIWLPTITCL